MPPSHTKQPSTPITLPPELRILTLNCWGLKYISTHRTARLSRIGHELASLTPLPQIICLQECWTQADYTSIRTSLRASHPYAKYYHSGIFGGGLALFSAFPIESSSMHRYPLNGRPTAFFRGDWFVGKGVAAAVLRIGPHENDVLEVLNTHLHAPYESEPHDSYICHRTAQAWEIAKLARSAREKGRLVIACGDFNMVPGSLAHEILETHGGVRDVWQVVRPEASLGAWDRIKEQAHGPAECPSVEHNLRVNGTTCDSLANTWRMGKEVSKRIKKGENVPVHWDAEDRRGKRLDYIFFSEAPTRYGDETRVENGAGQPRWTVQKAHVGMQTRHPTLHCSLSDHFSVEATLQLQPAAASPTKSTYSADTSATSGSRSQPYPYLPTPSYDQILALITTYVSRETTQRTFRLLHFILSIIISIACFVAIWWSPHNYVAFLLLLLSTLGFGAGLLDGLIGGLFVGSELRALREFEWEVWNVRGRAEGMEREGRAGGGGRDGNSEGGVGKNGSVG